MIHYQDDHTLIEILGRVIVITPKPLSDYDRAQELHEMFPVQNGWGHCRYSVRIVAADPDLRAVLVKLAEATVRTEAMPLSAGPAE
jgi:hypothetical protein